MKTKTLVTIIGFAVPLFLSLISNVYQHNDHRKTIAEHNKVIKKYDNSIKEYKEARDDIAMQLDNIYKSAGSTSSAIHTINDN